MNNKQNAIVLLFLLGTCQAGLVVHRNTRNAEEIKIPADTPAIIQPEPEPESLSLDLAKKDQIPVTIIETIEPEILPQKPLQSERKTEPLLAAIEPAPIISDAGEKPKDRQDEKSLMAATEQRQPALIDSELPPPPAATDILKETDSLKPEQSELKESKEKLLEDKPQSLEEQEQIQNLPAIAIPEESQLQQEQQQQLNGLRQAPAPTATQATPTQSSTQAPNLVQLIQNSPVGQFFSQLTGQNSQQQQASGGQLAADEPATAAPTIPGFLNPGGAFTSAQAAVQSVVNSTQQAIQGIQQFANNLGSQVQSTFTNLVNPQNTADSTTARPPGPLQGIISFFQGNNNRPGAQADTPQPAATPAALPAVEKPQQDAAVNDKIDAAKKKDEEISPPVKVETIPDLAPTEKPKPIVPAAETTNQADNEVQRASGEQINEDSFEEAAVPEELIVIEDDASQQRSAAPVKVEPVVQPIVEQLVEPVVKPVESIELKPQQIVV